MLNCILLVGIMLLLILPCLQRKFEKGSISFFLCPFFSSPKLQNHRMAELERDLWRSAGPTPLVKQAHLEPVAQDHLQMAFEYLQRWRLRHISGQAVPVLSHPHSEKVFTDVQREPPVSQFVPIASGPDTGSLWKKPVSVLYAPSLLYIYRHWWDLVLFFRLNNPSSLNLFS